MDLSRTTRKTMNHLFIDHFDEYDEIFSPQAMASQTDQISYSFEYTK